MSLSKTRCKAYRSTCAALLTLQHSLRAVSRYPLLALTTKGVSKSAIDVIQSTGIVHTPIKNLSPTDDLKPELVPENARYEEVWSKLRVFGFEDYERVILIDSDMLFLQTMDHLFDLELPARDWVAAVPACTCNPTKMDDYPEDW